MSVLQPIPPVNIDPARLAEFGRLWTRSNNLNKKSSIALGNMFDVAVGESLAVMLGGIPIVTPNTNALMPSRPNCVEVGPVRIIGGVRPQNFDVGYRPDGVRFAFDSKTLNDKKSVGKNWQNMVNDLATEATTVHSRFPHAVVAFMVIIPEPSISSPLQKAIIETLERLARRTTVDGPLYMAEAISLVLWNPTDGSIDPNIPGKSSILRFEKFSSQIRDAYIERYKGLPPHTK